MFDLDSDIEAEEDEIIDLNARDESPEPEKRPEVEESRGTERRRSRDYDHHERDPERRERRVDPKKPGRSSLPPPRSIPPPPGALNKPAKAPEQPPARQVGMLAYPDTMKETVAPPKPVQKPKEDSKDNKNVSKEKKDTTIFVNNLPDTLMDIVSVSGQFAKYGKVVNIKIFQERRSALIKFARATEAKQASLMPVEDTVLAQSQIVYNPTSSTPRSDPNQFKVKPGENKVYESDIMKKRKEEANKKREEKQKIKQVSEKLNEANMILIRRIARTEDVEEKKRLR